MTITIHNTSYNFEVNGTVGHFRRARHILGLKDADPKAGIKEEPLDFAGNGEHEDAIYYSVFSRSNKPCPFATFDDFVDNLTTDVRTAMRTHFWERLKELEPKWFDEKKPEEEDPKNE